jgi:hypothetical protein
MKSRYLCFAFAIMSSPLFAQQYLGSFPYNRNIEKDDNAGILVEIGGNMNDKFVNPIEGVTTAKGNTRLFPKIGLFYQRGFARHFSVRGSVSLSTNPFSYRYATVLDSIMRDSGVPTITSTYDKYTKRRQSGLMLQPQIDFGYVTDPIFFKTMSIEVRAGVGAPIYLSKKDTLLVYPGEVKDPKDQATSRYIIDEYTKQGNTAWGALVADVYIGVRWSGTFNNLLDRSALGVQLGFPIATGKEAYTEIKYYSTDWNGMIGHEEIKMQLFTVGVRYTYRFFK